MLWHQLWYLTIFSKCDFLENSNHLLILVWEFCLLNSYILCLLFSVNIQFVITLISKNLIGVTLKNYDISYRAAPNIFWEKNYLFIEFFFHKKIEYVCKSLCEFKARFTKALTFFSKKQFVLAKTLLHFNWSKNRKNNLCLIFSK